MSRSPWWSLGVGALLLAGTVALPRFVARENELRTGVRRGDARLEVRSSTTASAIDLSYDGAGYLYLWIVAIGPDGEVTPVVPAPGPWMRTAERARTYGRRAAPGGESLRGVPVPTARPLVLYGLLSPLPVDLDRIEAEARARAREGQTPGQIARSLPFRGYAREIGLR